jgi:hypothetical protein
MADDGKPDPAPEQGLDQRVSSLETGQQSLSEKLDKVLGIVSGGHDDQGSDPDGKGSPNIAHEIRAQLDARDARDREDAEKKSIAEQLAATQAKVAELAEKPPAPMPRRVEKIMGWS